MLNNIGSRQFDLEWAATFGDGLEALSTGEFEVCLVDCSTGGRDGTEILEEAESRGVATPLVMLTGMVNRDVDERAMALGAADYLVKNEITPGILDRTIRYAISRASLLNELARLAKYDPLTGLANRTLLPDFLDGAMARTRRSAQCMAVLLLDLDHFKNVNDQFGHDIGDLLLKQVAQCLTRSLRAGDLVARLGGDEFAVILDNIGTPENAGRVATKIISELSSTQELGGHKFQVGTSIGIACYETGAEASADLIKSADTAMYEVKRSGRNAFQYFVPQMQAHALKKASLESDFVRAIDAGELELHYQPQISGWHHASSVWRHWFGGDDMASYCHQMNLFRWPKKRT
jgi:diguanylate cyclase (GGDEF)-like protein